MRSTRGGFPRVCRRWTSAAARARWRPGCRAGASRPWAWTSRHRPSPAPSGSTASDRGPWSSKRWTSAASRRPTGNTGSSWTAAACTKIHPADAPSYLRTIVSVSAPDARMLLFVKAFRHDVPLNDASEWRRVSDQVEQAMSPSFEIVRRRQTFLDPFEGRRSARALPGIGFWLVRRPEAAPATADGR